MQTLIITKKTEMTVNNIRQYRLKNFTRIKKDIL